MPVNCQTDFSSPPLALEVLKPLSSILSLLNSYQFPKGNMRNIAIFLPCLFIVFKIQNVFQYQFVMSDSMQH